MIVKKNSLQHQATDTRSTFKLKMVVTTPTLKMRQIQLKLCKLVNIYASKQSLKPNRYGYTYHRI